MRNKHRAHLSTSRAFLGSFKNHSQTGSQYTSAIIDISESGAQIATSAPLKKSEHIELLWSPVLGVPPLTLVGRCVWVKGDRAGLQFSQLEPKAKFVLTSLIKFHLGKEISSK